MERVSFGTAMPAAEVVAIAADSDGLNHDKWKCHTHLRHKPTATARLPPPLHLQKPNPFIHTEQKYCYS